MAVDKILQAKCRNLLKEYTDVFDYVVRDIIREIESERISGDSPFEYAKKVIRKESIKEGLTLFQQRINKYAEQN